MARNNNLIGRQVQTPVAFVIGGIAKENTHGRARRKFVDGCGRKVGIAETTKYT